MLLSAVSVLVVAQSNSEIPEGLMNNPVYKANSTSLDRPWGFQEAEAFSFIGSLHVKVLGLSALRTGHLYTTGNIPGTHICQRLSLPQGHKAAERTMSVTPSGMEPVTFHLVAQCLNQLRHSVPPSAT